MKNMIILALMLASASAWGNCVSDPAEHMKEISQGGESDFYKLVEHKVFVPKDSCGASGCEIFVFSPRSEKCHELTLNVKGHLLPETLKLNHIGISVDGKLRRYRYNVLERKFK